jgi:HlyD family secretion protein
VQFGVSSLGEVEIVSGLQPGEKVVVSGTDLFGDAERVSIN